MNKTQAYNIRHARARRLEHYCRVLGKDLAWHLQVLAKHGLEAGDEHAEKAREYERASRLCCKAYEHAFDAAM